MKRQTPIFQYFKGDFRGDLFSYQDSYYYKIYYNIGAKYKLIGQSYVNIFDRKLCTERMMHEIEIIEEAKAKRAK